MSQPAHCGRANTKPRNKRLGTGAECFKKGLSAGFGAGIDKGRKEGKAAGKKVGKVLGEVKGRKKGIKIGKVAMRLGHGLNMVEVNSLSKDQLRDMVLRRKKKGISTSAGAISRKSKAQLKTDLLADLRRTNKLKE